jgi:Zn-dependent peptidase ImmA (M78 family)
MQCTQDFNDHMEWQANEGAAQFLMPYQSFIPNYVYLHDHYYSKLSVNHAAKSLVAHLSRQYKVGYRAAEYRINGLKKEIAQYLDGKSIENIVVKSCRT